MSKMNKEERINLKRMNNNRNEARRERPSIKDILRSQFKENVLLVATIIAVTLGISLGFVLRTLFEFNDNEIKYFGFIGQIFLRMLKFLILPLIAFRLANFRAIKSSIK